MRIIIPRDYFLKLTKLIKYNILKRHISCTIEPHQVIKDKVLEVDHKTAIFNICRTWPSKNINQVFLNYYFTASANKQIFFSSITHTPMKKLHI